MMQISSTFRSALLSPRTADYIAALSQEGDNFDYCKWLQQAREVEAQAEEFQQTSAEQIALEKIDVPVSTSNRPEASVCATYFARFPRCGGRNSALLRQESNATHRGTR
jgi:hypothetical protein